MSKLKTFPLFNSRLSFIKDRQLYKEFIEGQGFESVGNAAICDLLGCHLKFIKK
ncbi:MAG: hypothetical protein M0016_07350 [Deltaproteobacteria bacterium]|jgi:hypothetical protein|nr:hypothetical protein [Deltaproteobacteria bacterium]MCL5879256.1 hypothetical protein [Deltaproteobacteria bacterium]MDA8304961.1 hypothetical protein [Deltaproteobacteria bacterium]